MEPVPQSYIDELHEAHGNITKTLSVLSNVQTNHYVPLEELEKTIQSMSVLLPAQYRDQIEGYIFASGQISKAVGYEKYTGMLVNGGHGLTSIGDTQATQLLEQPIFNIHLKRTIDQRSDNLDVQDILHGYKGDDGKRVKGIWDDISRRYAEQAQGHIVTVSPRSQSDRVFVESELPSLMDKILEGDDIKSINGIPAVYFADAYDALKEADVTDDEIYETLDRVLIQSSSAALLSRYSEQFPKDVIAVLNHEFSKTNAGKPSADYKDLLENIIPEIMGEYQTIFSGRPDQTQTIRDEPQALHH